MDIPYGFDCFAFQREEIKYFASNLNSVRRAVLMPPKRDFASDPAETTSGRADYVKFTRKNEDYPREQVLALGRANRLNMSEIDKRLFCGIKIQIGIGVVTNFLRKGLQYKPPIKGRSELLPNGSWTGIMKGLTIRSDAPESYDLALGNFLAWDEEFPHINFGPFFAVESKLVFLTGSSRRVETSSFGTNITREIWITILTFLTVLSLLASLQIHWQHQKRLEAERAGSGRRRRLDTHRSDEPSLLAMILDFFFIYFTMLLSKPSHEFDELIWPKSTRRPAAQAGLDETLLDMGGTASGSEASFGGTEGDGWGPGGGRAIGRVPRSRLPTSMRALSYVWSAACLVLASIYSGEMLAVMLLHTDQNIDTIVQLINSKPLIEPVIRQDDFTHNLMLKSLDQNMLKLHNMTRTIPRTEVYSRQFIENVSKRKVALLGDDELIETIFDLYHKYYPLYKSKVTYLQFPISIIYRKNLNATLERKLRRGMVQIFEMGLIDRWYEAQKDTYIQFYDTFERNKTTEMSLSSSGSSNAGQKYKPLSMHHFNSFFRAMFYCSLFAVLVLAIEIVHSKLVPFEGRPS